MLRAILKSLAFGVVLIVVGLGVYQYIRGASDLQRLELTDRCQQMGERFVQEIRAADKQAGIPPGNQKFIYGSALQPGRTKMFCPDREQVGIAVFGARLLSTQVWDVSAGVGVTAFAEKSVPLSKGNDAITQGILAEGVAFYRGEARVPATSETNKWFDNLMTQ